MNACIQLTGALDGCQLLTVEDLRGPEGALHPVQQAMVETHASQCGFCTPGIVMALWATTRAAAVPRDDQAIDDALAGNLCLEGWADEATLVVRDGDRRFIAPAHIARLVCPIGGSLRDKRPPVIAALAAAELLTCLATP